MQKEKFRTLKSVGQILEPTETSESSILKSEFQKRLTSVRSDSDVSELISDINLYLKNKENLTSDIISDLKNVRQKAYDRKKKYPTSDDPKTSESDRAPIFSDRKSLDTDQKPNIQYLKFNIGSLFRNKNILVSILKMMTYILCASLSMWFVFEQSIPIYKAIGFSDPTFCAFGSILLIIGFSILYSLTNSKILLLLCIYASSYEVALIVRGTYKDESVQLSSKIENNQQISWLTEKANHSKEAYLQAKEKYDNPSSNVYKNSWFQKKFLEPAWYAYSQDQSKIENMKTSLSSSLGNGNSISLLKVMFRLGLVLLGMVSIHKALRTVQMQY